MTNPHPKNSRAATIWEAGYNAGRWAPPAPCPYKQPWCVETWKAGRRAAWEDLTSKRVLNIRTEDE